MAVCVGHIRNLVLKDYTPGYGVFARAFYFVTGYGHSAVVVFFVLSGYFVGGSVMRSFRHGRFTWRAYLTDRMTRLWIVLIPALFATLFWDVGGIRWGEQVYYLGIEGNLALQRDVTTNLEASVFLCNAVFLQTIACPSYGSNGPLWSLANEFWYYLWAPVLLSFVLLIRHAKENFRLGFTFGALVVMSVLMITSMAWAPELLPGFVVWLFGAAIAWTDHYRPVRSMPRGAVILALAALCGLLVLARMGRLSDVFLGLGFSVFILVLLWSGGWPASSNRIVSRVLAIGPILSNFSYSLYLTHFPLALFITSVTVRARSEYSLPGLLVFALLSIACYVYAYGFYWVFERNTPRLRAAIDRISNARMARPQ
jgi:peptidoglycan/LPS O-acetylase OafA/YrhL